MASTIGIKVANGEFYPIINEDSTVKKRLVLTTVHDNQRSVQIDLYKSAAKSMTDALYIGSLVVENIKSGPKGDPSIEMVISSTGGGEITADAIDLDSSTGGEHQILTVSLKSLDGETQEYEIPDFELEQNEPPPAGLYDKANTINEREKIKNFSALVVIIIGVAVIIICLALWFFLFRDKSVFVQQKPRTPVESPAPVTPAPSPGQTTQPGAPAQPPAPVTPPPVIQAPPAAAQSASPSRPAVNRTRTPAPVSSYKVPATIPKNGAPYRIRWGDTLWDISDAFYRDPWQYRRIARFNNIGNPNLIVSGTTIRIPPGD